MAIRYFQIPMSLPVNTPDGPGYLEIIAHISADVWAEQYGTDADGNRGERRVYAEIRDLYRVMDAALRSEMDYLSDQEKDWILEEADRVIYEYL